MRKGLISMGLLLLFVLIVFTKIGRAGWIFQFISGSARNVSTPLTISQKGKKDLNFWAHYKTKPFYEAPYYAYKLEEWRGKEFLGFELYYKK